MKEESINVSLAFSDAVAAKYTRGGRCAGYAPGLGAFRITMQGELEIVGGQQGLDLVDMWVQASKSSLVDILVVKAGATSKTEMRKIVDYINQMRPRNAS